MSLLFSLSICFLNEDLRRDDRFFIRTTYVLGFGVVYHVSVLLAAAIFVCPWPETARHTPSYSGSARWLFLAFWSTIQVQWAGANVE